MSRPKRTIALWLLISLFGLLAAFRLSDYLTAVTDVPGSPSAQASELVKNEFNENADGSFGIIYHFKNASDAEIDDMKARIGSAVATIPTAHVAYERAIAGILVAYVGSELDLASASVRTNDLRQALADQGLGAAWVTGPPALENDVRPVLSKDLQRGGAIAIVLALAFLILALGTTRALVVPFIVAGATVATTLGVLFLLAQVTTMVLYIPNVVELIGLGLAIDYSLLIIHRLRHESLTLPFDQALKRTMATAGRTVFFSGITVALGLATLVLIPVPFIRSLGLAGVVVPMVAIAVALTLQPALLSLLGASGIAPGRFRGILLREQFWSRLAASVIRRPVAVLLSSILVLLLAAAPVLGIKLAPASLTSVPKGVESATALEFIAERAGRGLITPHVLIVDTAAGSTATDAARLKLADALSRDPDVASVATDSTGLFVDPSGRYQRIFVISKYDFGNDRAQDQVVQFRNLDLTSYGYPANATIYVAGAAAQGYDFLHQVERSFPLVLLLILLLAFTVMYRALKSVVLPIKAVVLNLFSVTATLGLVVAIFQWLLGSASIESWAVVLLFATLFGLSMDYHIFIVSRMRESWDEGESNEDSIAHGLQRTSSVVTAAAVIFVGALTGLIFGSLSGLQQLGVGLALGVLIDATIVRGLLLPSAMVLLQKWNWWAPAVKQGPTKS